jgi:hypothetical protein
METNKDMLTINELGMLIKREWSKPYFGATPYIDAMIGYNQAYCESEREIVLYFLSNASTFRGEVAKEIKLALKKKFNIK